MYRECWYKICIKQTRVVTFHYIIFQGSCCQPCDKIRVPLHSQDPKFALLAIFVLKLFILIKSTHLFFKLIIQQIFCIIQCTKNHWRNTYTNARPICHANLMQRGAWPGTFKCISSAVLGTGLCVENVTFSMLQRN